MPRQTKKQKKSVQPSKGELNRFAGSSEEDDSDDDDADMDIGATTTAVDYKADAEDEASSDEELEMKHKPSLQKDRQLKQEDEETSSDDDDGSDAGARTSGMASAMARILGSAPPTTKQTPSAVLSKTKTPLQKQAELEEQREKELKQKKVVNRERNVAALHIPLSVATSANLQGSSTLHAELQQERAHRRIATRGVVALFNAIAQHQHGHGHGATDEKQGADGSKKPESVAKLTKHSFLDMIKSKAKGAATTTKEDSKNESANGKKQWNALRDDYMLDSKKPDWEDDGSSLDGGAGQEGGLSDDSERDPISLPKKQKIRARAR